MVFQEEQVIARIRRSWWSLFLPLVVLFLAASAVSYVSNRVVEPWVLYVTYSLAAVVAVLFWLVPTIRHLNFYVELTTSRLIVRDGIFAQKTTEVALADISSLSLGRGRSVTIGRKAGEAIALESLPKAKLLVSELRRLAKIDA